MATDSAADGAGPPAQFCPDDLVRRVVYDVPSEMHVQQLWVQSLADRELVFASLRAFEDSSAGALLAWSVDRATGSSTLVYHTDELRHIIDARTWTSGGTVLLADWTGSGPARRLRWSGSELEPVIDTAAIPSPLRLMLARSTADSDTVLRLFPDEATGEARMERWQWPATGDPEQLEVDTTALDGYTLPRGFFGRPMAQDLDAAGIMVVVLASRDGRLIRMDDMATRVLGAHEFRADALEPGSFVPFSADSAALVVQSGDRSSLWRASADAFEKHLELPSKLETPRAAAAHPGALLAAHDREVASRVSDPEEHRQDGPLYLARVHDAEPTVEGGFRAIMTGCIEPELSAPPPGGAVVACTEGFDPSKRITLTYFCVPEVE